MFKDSLFRKTGVAWAILGIGLLVTVFASFLVRQGIEQAAVKQFACSSDQVTLSYVTAWVTLVGGLALSGLLFGLLRSMINTQANAVRIADKLTEESKRQAKLLMEGEAFKLAILNSLAAETQAGAVRIAGKLAEESKRHAKVLMESEAFKLTLMNSLAAEIAVVDRDGVIQAVNEPWQRSELEHKIGAGEPAPHTEVGANYLEVCQAGVGFTSDEDAVHAHEGIQAVLDGSLPSFSMEYPSHSPTQQQWFMMTVLPMGEGASRNVVVTHTDITGRKQAEEELRSSEERLSIITSSAQDAIIMLDEAGNIVFWNQAAERLFGYTQAEIIGHDLHSTLVPQSLREGYRQAFQDFQQTGQGVAIGKTVELAGLRKDGSEFPLEVAISSVQVKGAWHLIGIVRDITERIEAQHELTRQLERVRQAEETLRIANEEQRAIFDSATSGIALIKEGIILRCNRKLGELFGYVDGELDSASTQRWYPDEAAYQASSKVIEDGKFHRFEQQFIRKDGSLFWARLSGQALDNKDPALGIVGIIDDITLEHEATDALLKAKEMAEEATRIKSDFLTNMSHGIRTPMNGVLGMLDLLRETDLTPVQLDWVETAHSSGEILREIISNILDLSKLEAGKVEVEQVDFNLVDLVDDSCAAMAGRAHAKGLELNCLLPQALSSHWLGDPLRIRQVLANLIDNAVKFTEQGEVAVTVTQAVIAEGKHELRFEVRDTGIGITPAVQLQLFKSFSQGDSATLHSFGGSGLGLFISKKLVELMGGVIGVDSVQGVGSCFWFTLPLAQSESVESAESFYDLAGKHALIVDDNVTNRNILGTYLRQWGFEISAFDNGSAALMALQTSTLQGSAYDLIVLDMQMPNMDGLTLAKYLAEIPALAKIPIILLSSGDQLELADYQNTGIVQRLLKPARQMQLFDAVVNALRGSSPITRQPAKPKLLLPSYKGKKVLVVEDNKINQKVIVAKLAKFDIVPDLAENGQLALDKLAQSRYDLILMDCQMPVMDGFIATRGLRLLEASHGLPHQTVIALTASAMKGDREKCLAAGMDDYLAKPIVTEQLMGMLARRLEPEITPVLPAENSAPAKPEPIVWDAAAALDNLDGDSALLDEMIAMFLIEGPKLLGELARVQAEGDLPALANAAHAIKGTVAQFYAASAKECALLLEQTARSGQTTDYQGMIDAVVKAVTDLINNLRLAKNTTKPGK